MPDRDAASSRRRFLVRASAAATLAATAALFGARAIAAGWRRCLKPAHAEGRSAAFQRVAATGGTALHYFLARVLAKFDMKLSDVDFVNLAAADGQAAFVAGRVDAIVPSDNGRFCIMSERTDTRELFTCDGFTKPPGPTQPFLELSGFCDLATVKQRMKREDFRARPGYQVKFFMDLGQIKTALDLGKAIVTDLL